MSYVISCIVAITAVAYIIPLMYKWKIFGKSAPRDFEKKIFKNKTARVAIL